MDEIFKDTQEQIDTFYKCALDLMLKDYKTKVITIEQMKKCIVAMQKKGN